jgi:ferritin-like metal-binding protein YciE
VADTIRDQLTAYLSDAHSIEEQALAQLRIAPDMAVGTALAAAFRDHIPETEGHERTMRDLLEGRDEKPSWFKDTLMRLGGKGFVLFARAQPDTPGKLLAHALSYEALEEASYALLATVAARAGDPDTAAAATRIEGEEIAMKERLAGCFDDAVAASLRALDPHDLQKQVGKYLEDAHALERQAIELLERASGTGSAPLSEAYEEHLAETRDHADAVEARLSALGRDPSRLKDAFMRLGGINWATFFRGHPDTPGKVAAFTYAFEYLEIGGYEQLRRVARRAGDDGTAALATRILEQERGAAASVKSLLPEAADLALRAGGVAW